MSKSENKRRQVQQEEVIEAAAVEQAPVEEPVVEETELEVPVVKPLKEPATGVVVDCARLRVRYQPALNARVICEIVKGTEVEIDEENSTVDFYKVHTVEGVEGFCMKKFIAINA